MKKEMLVTMPDGAVYAVPVMTIARHRAKYYAQERKEFDCDLQRSLDEDTIPLFTEDTYEIEDWAANNMNWDDVNHDVRRVSGPELPDFQEGWVNGDKDFV